MITLVGHQGTLDTAKAVASVTGSCRNTFKDYK